MLRTAIIIPALNEAQKISSVIQDSRKFGDVVVVDDGSTDETGEIARAAGAVVVRHETPQGYDGALSSGFNFARQSNYEVMVTIDADGQLSAADIPRFIDQIQSGADLAIGERPQWPRVSEFIFAKICHMLTEIRDPFCGFKAYRLSQYEPEKKFDIYHSIGTDLMITTVLAKGRIVNLPIVVQRRDGNSRIGGLLRAELKIFRAAMIGTARLLSSRFVKSLKRKSDTKETTL